MPSELLQLGNIAAQESLGRKQFAQSQAESALATRDARRQLVLDQSTALATTVSQAAQQLIEAGGDPARVAMALRDRHLPAVQALQQSMRLFGEEDAVPLIQIEGLFERIASSPSAMQAAQAQAQTAAAGEMAQAEALGLPGTPSQQAYRAGEADILATQAGIQATQADIADAAARRRSAERAEAALQAAVTAVRDLTGEDGEPISPAQVAAFEAALRGGAPAQALQAVGLTTDAPMVNVELPEGQTARQKAEGEAIADITTAQLPNLRKQIAQLEAMESMLDSGVETGGMRQLALAAANMFNVDAGELSDLAAFRAVAGSATLTKSAELKGPTSDRDIRFIQESVASAGTSTAGNRAIIKIQKKLYDRERDSLKLMERYFDAKGSLGGFEDFQEAWAEEHPLFTPEEEEEITRLAGLRGAGEAQAAEPIPPPAEREIGKVYTNPQGVQARWTGTGWEGVQ